MKSDKAKTITAWIICAVILIVYLLTVAPTISFWDSPEFITCARTMGIPHPPGSPLLSLVGRVMSVVPFYDFRGGGFEHIAYRINLINVLTGAFTIVLTYLIIIKLITRISPFRGALRHDWVIMFSATIAALMAAFSHQFWENAIETETYMPSLFLSMLAVWLTLKWEERKHEPGAVRYLFLTAYLIGLGNGIHLYALLIVPTVFLIVLSAKSSWFTEPRLWVIFFLVMAGIVAIRLLGGKEIFYLIMAFLTVACPFFLWRLYCSEIQIWKITLLGMLFCLSLFVVGYSVYPTIMIRASKKPAINEGNPDNWARYKDYLERKQYDQGNMYLGIFSRNADLRYQFGFMYFRYLLRQFPKWGPSPQVTFTNSRSAEYPGQDVAVRKNACVPVLLWTLLILGLYTHFRYDVRHFGVFFLYFLATSVGLVLYLNMENPQVRERGYFFLGSFHIIMVWVGFGVYSVITTAGEMLEERKFHRMATPVTVLAAVVLSTIVPAAVLSNHIDHDYTNFQVHDRSRNLIPFDYGFNILNFCESNAILFTHGDNDTYPLWYLQEVEGIRRDVRVVNLSLLNAPWYIKQLRDEGVTIPITYTDDFIDNRLCGQTLRAHQTRTWTPEPKEVTIAGLTWEMPPTYVMRTADGGSVGVLNEASIMIAHIIKTVNWKRPIYFAVTIEPSKLIGLNQFMSTEGMVFRLTREKAPERYHINAIVLDRNVFTTYRYRGVTDPTVYKSPETLKLVHNYYIGFLDLCERYMELGDRENAVRAARGSLERYAPDLDQRILLYTLMGETGLEDELERMIDAETERLQLDNVEESSAVGVRFLLEPSLNRVSVLIFKKLIDRHPRSELAWKGYASALYQSGRYDEALEALDSLLTMDPSNIEAAQLREMILQNRSRP